MEFNLADLFESLVSAIPDRDALVCGDERLTYLQLEARANRAAHALAARGVGPGDHVGLYLFNGPAYVEAMIGCFKLRAVPINVNYRYVAEELRYLCDNADLKVLVFQQELAPHIAAVAGHVPTLRALIHVEDESGSPIPANGLESIAYEAALAAASPARDFAPRSGDDLYVIYTGGTTGMPRGVMWRHKDLFYAGLQGGAPGGEPVMVAEQLAENAREEWRAMAMLPVAPLIHGAAQFAVWIALFTGGKGVFVPGRRFDPDATWRLVERERVTTILIVGDAMARPLADALERSATRPEGPWDTSAMMALASSGAILSGSVKAQLERLLPSTLVINNYGSSESGHQGAAMAGEDGRVVWIMGDTTTVLDEHMKPVEPGSGVLGKIARRGYVPVGYYKDPVKSAQTFIEIDGVRWVIPGDLATVEADGSITFFGRGSACINTGGEKVFPEEVEEALKTHPSVADANVVGLPDDRWGQAVTAVLAFEPGRTATESGRKPQSAPMRP